MLSDDRGTSAPIDAFDRVPYDPGLYIVYSDVYLPGLEWDALAGPLYVGKADDGLRRRLEREHGGDTGRSTLRRSLAGLLKDELQLVARVRPTRGEPKDIDFYNFALESDGDDRLSDWMADHLTVSVMPGASGDGRESELIAEMEPPLNLRGWDNPWRKTVSEARARCAAEARRRAFS